MKIEMIAQMRNLLNTFETIIAEDEQTFKSLTNKIDMLQSICDNQQAKLYDLENQLNEQKQKKSKNSTNLNRRLMPNLNQSHRRLILFKKYDIIFI